MLFKIAPALALLAVSSSTTASPLASVQERGLEVRKGGLPIPDVGEIIEIAEAVVDLIKGISQLVHQQDAESQYTQSTLTKLAAQYPDKNVLVYSDNKSGQNLVNAVCAQHDLDIGLGFTKGYNLCVFDSGSFDRHGDGGYVNWAFEGNFKRDGSSSHVDFFTIDSSTPTKRGLDVSLTFNWTPRPGTNHTTHIPLHPPVIYSPPAMAAPMLPPAQPISTKPADDGNYLVSCHAGNGTTALGVAYYKAVVPHGGNKGQSPDDFVLLVETTPKNAGNKTAAPVVNHDSWRFPVGAMTFADTQSIFHWSVFGNSLSDNVTVDQTAGFANNGNDFFWIYKDDGKQLFTKDAWTCSSLYYAL